jgi:hypothetical protein
MKIEKQLRVLQVYTGILTLVLVTVFVSGFQATTQKLQELTVERINIVEPNGKLRLTISNKERFPDPVINGKTLVGARHGAKAAGLLFFNDDGDECGGLAWHGKETAQQAEAGADIMFDQFHQDQTVGIAYSQTGDHKSAGLHIWDRPAIPLASLVEKMQAIEHMPAGEEKQAKLDEIKQATARGELGAHRLFVGKAADGSTGMTVADRLGKNRISLVVDKDNTAHLQFLDDDGKVIYSVPPSEAAK